MSIKVGSRKISMARSAWGRKFGAWFVLSADNALLLIARSRALLPALVDCLTGLCGMPILRFDAA
jgi:hypothetical protein